MKKIIKRNWILRSASHIDVPTYNGFYDKKKTFRRPSPRMDNHGGDNADHYRNEDEIWIMSDTYLFIGNEFL